MSQTPGRHPRGLGLLGFMLALLTAHLVVLWTVPVLPFPDLGFHLAAAQIERDHEKPGAVYDRYFDVQPPTPLKPNMLHLHWCSAEWMPSVIFANQVMLSAYVISVPLLMFMIIRELGGSPWLVPLSCLVLYNYSTAYGFAPFMTAIPLLLALLYALVQWQKRDHWLWPCLVAGLLALTFLGHAMAAVFALILFGAFVCLRYLDRPAHGMAALLLAGPVIALLAHWYLTGGGGEESGFLWLIHYYKTRYIAEFPQRVLDWFTLDNRALISPVMGRVISGALTLSVLAIALLRVRSMPKWRKLGRRLAVIRQRPGLVVAALWLAGGFVVLFGPPGLPPYWSIYQRFTCFMVLAVVLWAAVLYGRRPPTAPVKAIIVLLAVVHLGFWAEHFIAFADESRALRRVLPEPMPGQVLGVYLSESTYRGDTEAFNHLANYHTVWHGGMVVSALYDFPYTPVRRGVDEQRLPHNGTVRDEGPDILIQSPTVQHVLVRGEIDASSSPRFKNHFEPVRTAGQWVLYGRRYSSPADTLVQQAANAAQKWVNEE